MGVSFFLILSGFVMSVGYEERVQLPSFSWKSFMLKRLIRLWPLHLLCLGSWIILAYAAWGSSAIYPLPLLGNALLLQWLPIEHIGGNSVAWCLSILVVFYAVYPLLARLKTVQLFLLFLLIHIGLRMFEVMFPIADIHWYWCRFPISRILEFLIGILCYRSYQHIITPYGNSVLRRIFQYTHTHTRRLDCRGDSSRFMCLGAYHSECSLYTLWCCSLLLPSLLSNDFGLCLIFDLST